MLFRHIGSNTTTHAVNTLEFTASRAAARGKHLRVNTATKSMAPNPTSTPKSTPKKAATPAKQPKTPVKAQKSEESAFGGLAFNTAVALLAVGVWYASENVDLKARLPPAAANKPYSDFESFFPFYLKEHSDSVNRGLHFIGTSLALTVALVYPAALLALFVAGASRHPIHRDCL